MCVFHSFENQFNLSKRSSINKICWFKPGQNILLFCRHIRFHSSRDSVALSWLSSYGVGSGRSSGSLSSSKYGCSRASSAVGLSSPSRTSIFSSRSTAAKADTQTRGTAFSDDYFQLRLHDPKLMRYNRHRGQGVENKSTQNRLRVCEDGGNYNADSRNSPCALAFENNVVKSFLG